MLTNILFFIRYNSEIILCFMSFLIKKFCFLFNFYNYNIYTTKNLWTKSYINFTVTAVSSRLKLNMFIFQLNKRNRYGGWKKWCKNILIDIIRFRTTNFLVTNSNFIHENKWYMDVGKEKKNDVRIYFFLTSN